MGAALATGWCAAGLGERLFVVEPNPSPAIKALKRRVGFPLVARLPADAPHAEALVLAVKPQMLGDVAPAYRAAAKGAVTVSIAAGTTLGRLGAWLGEGAAIVRAMPNLPASIGQGISVATGNDHVTPKQRKLAERLLSAGGAVLWSAHEADLDAVTAVSGSGPAYLFLLAECLEEAAIAEGLSADMARVLARETVIGAAALLARSDAAPSFLRESVTSPGGTTAAALSVLMGKGGLSPLLKRAVAKATKRSRALGKSG